jgi:hypothetical protein
MSVQRESPRHISCQKVGERSTKPLGFVMPYCFYIYNISSHDFGVFRLPKLKSIYLLRERCMKSIAERSYSLLWGRDFTI